MVVLPVPDSPLPIDLVSRGSLGMTLRKGLTYKNTTAWFSPRPPSLAHALPAISSASAIALPSFPPFGPLAEEVYVLREIRPCEERRAVGSAMWKLIQLAAYMESLSAGFSIPTGKMGCYVCVRL